LCYPTVPGKPLCCPDVNFKDQIPFFSLEGFPPGRFLVRSGFVWDASLLSIYRRQLLFLLLNFPPATLPPNSPDVVPAQTHSLNPSSPLTSSFLVVCSVHLPLFQSGCKKAFFLTHPRAPVYGKFKQSDFSLGGLVILLKVVGGVLSRSPSPTYQAPPKLTPVLVTQTFTPLIGLRCPPFAYSRFFRFLDGKLQLPVFPST